MPISEINLHSKPSRLRPVGWFCLLLSILIFTGLISGTVARSETTNFFVHGVLKEIRPAEHQLVISHEYIPGFMDAMTMPFNVKDDTILTNVTAGTEITFQLHVTETESWVDAIKQINASPANTTRVLTSSKTNLNLQAAPPAPAIHHSNNPLRYYKFTNELGQPISLSDFHGQAIALTFFFTRCPIPEFCPRLSRNFEEVERKMKLDTNAPANWHLLSISFDSSRDTPAVLQAYGQNYHYDPAHWSFLTGPPEKIAELAKLCDVKFDPDNGFFNHNFRTLIIDSSNRLQMVFPTSGDLSDSIVQELIKAANPTNQVLKTSELQVPVREKK